MSASNEPRPQLEEARDPFSSYQPVDAATALFTLNRAGGTDAANLHSPMPEQSGRNADAVNKLALPGIGLPIKQDSELPIEGRRGDWRHCATPVTVRERVMIAIMAALKDKPDWERKVFDELTVDKWRQEALTASDAVQAQEGTGDTPTAVDEQTQPDEVRDATSHYNAPARQRVVTERLFQYCIDELRDQAAGSLKNKFTEVMEANAAVYISDGLVSLDTKMALRSGVMPLESVPDNLKDRHPGSDDKVLDLVHPSLYPLMYGRSKYLPLGTVPLQQCSAYAGQGNTVPTPTLSAKEFEYSAKHQWLPCEVLLGDSGEAKITSYINNLHPDGNEALYAAIEKVISKAIPLWKATVRSTLYRYERPRLKVNGDGYDHEAVRLVEEEREKQWQERRDAEQEARTCQTGGMEDAGEVALVLEADPGNDTNGDDSDGDDDNDDYDDEEDDEYIKECFKSKYIKVPEPGPYEPRMRTTKDEDASGFRQTFLHTNLQVIVKLANIHLTPDKPTYDGGSWHIEGLPNEHICASALYYYDSSNVTESFLAFRESVDEETLTMYGQYAQGQPGALIEIYGLDDPMSPNLPALQVLGKVLTREGRLLVFPNVLQHRVLPFELDDTTRPGHRKLLALFLVDPNIKIPSTANIPPQQRHWWAQKIDETGGLRKLPPELKEQVYSNLDFPLTGEQAKQVREDLMEERKAQLVASVKKWQNERYSFCEH